MDTVYIRIESQIEFGRLISEIALPMSVIDSYRGDVFREGYEQVRRAHLQEIENRRWIQGTGKLPKGVTLDPNFPEIAAGAV